MFFFQAEDGIRDVAVTGVQTCALPILATAHDPGFHSGQREFNGWNPQEEKVDFISQLLEAANHAQVAPARKSRLKAEALAVFYSELNLFEHQPPGGKAAASGLNGDTPW